MIKNYLRTALRALRKHVGYTVINVFGLALGMACCLLILMLVHHEWSFDRFHAKADRIYRVLMQETPPDGDVYHGNLIPPPVAPAMAESFSSIETLTRVVGGTRDVRLEGELFPTPLYMVDSTFLDIFSFPLLAGDRATALDDPQSVVVTKETARRFFGDAPLQDILGRTLDFERGDSLYSFSVTGVAAEVPATSSLQFEVLMSFEQYDTLPIGANDWGGRTSLYVLLREGESPGALEAAFPPFSATQLASRIESRRQAGLLKDGDDALRLILQPLTALHLEPGIRASYEVNPHNPRYSYILMGIALAVLLIACINFMTLSVGRSLERAREVGVRKTLGANRGQLMRQFWGEALLLSGLALGVALLLVWGALPTFNTLTGKEFVLSDFGAGRSLVALGGLTLLVGLVAGSYPAAILSGFQPAVVLKGGGSRRGHGRSRLTRGLVVAQYTISVALLICTVIMYQQLDYLLSKDLGFDGDQVAVVHTPRLTTAQEKTILDVFRSEVKPYEQVVDVVKTGWAFTYSYDTRTWTAADGTSQTAHMIGIDYDYLEVLDMELVSGRTFSRERPSDPTQSVLVNEAFVREYGIDDPVGHQLSGFGGFFGDVTPTIIGVVKDFHFRSLHEKVEPAVLNMHPDYYVGMQALLVKIRPGDVTETVDRMEATWTQVFPDKPFHYSFLDEDMDAQYQAEQRWRTILTNATLLAIFIACMGLFGLATLSVARRTKEIGIRKALGASLSSLALLVTKEFALLVGIATVIAWPIAYWGMQRWLQDFAYHIAMPWWVFPAAGLLALAIAVLTVGYHALRAARTDPVNALRYE